MPIQRTLLFNSLPNNKILDLSKLKAFADKNSIRINFLPTIPNFNDTEKESV